MPTGDGGCVDAYHNTCHAVLFHEHTRSTLRPPPRLPPTRQRQRQRNANANANTPPPPPPPSTPPPTYLRRRQHPHLSHGLQRVRLRRVSTEETRRAAVPTGHGASSDHLWACKLAVPCALRGAASGGAGHAHRDSDLSMAPRSRGHAGVLQHDGRHLVLRPAGFGPGIRGRPYRPRASQ